MNENDLLAYLNTFRYQSSRGDFLRSLPEHVAKPLASFLTKEAEGVCGWGWFLFAGVLFLLVSASIGAPDQMIGGGDGE